MSESYYLAYNYRKACAQWSFQQSLDLSQQLKGPVLFQYHKTLRELHKEMVLRVWCGGSWNPDLNAARHKQEPARTLQFLWWVRSKSLQPGFKTLKSDKFNQVQFYPISASKRVRSFKLKSNATLHTINESFLLTLYDKYFCQEELRSCCLQVFSLTALSVYPFINSA